MKLVLSGTIARHHPLAQKNCFEKMEVIAPTSPRLFPRTILSVLSTS
jgi:hypothetical protein